MTNYQNSSFGGGRSSQDVNNLVSGVLVIDKPVGLTSHDVVQIIRRGTGIRRAGHTGTLDPRASGVLVVLIGPAVRLSEFVSAEDKRYQATIQLGSSTDTYDSEGVSSSPPVAVNVEKEAFTELLKKFIGEIEQKPPPYSAVKVQGQRAYDMARRGEEVDLEPRIIHVHSLELLEWALPEVVIDVHCSSGTYVRSLAHDIGEELGVGAHLVGLRRTRSGRFTLRDAVSLRRLREAFEHGTWAQHLIPAAEALADWPAIELDEATLEKVRNGHRIPAKEGDQGLARAVSEQGDLVAIMEVNGAEWQPRKVFFSS
ncbi:MAG: tRNA pseudouridine(55) synthase TruB [Anaerolineales bacterium]